MITLLSEHSTPFDRGGLLDLVRSSSGLQIPEVDDSTLITTFTPSEVKTSTVLTWRRQTSGRQNHFGSATQTGDRKEFFIRIPKNVGSITLTRQLGPRSHPARQQARLKSSAYDAILARHGARDRRDAERLPHSTGVLVGPASVTIPDPDRASRDSRPGDWSNAGDLHCDFTITSTLKQS